MFSVCALVAAAIFFHGQFDAKPWKTVARALSMVIVAGAAGYAAYHKISYFPYALLAAVSSAGALSWGARIGWGRDVLWAQALKGVWLALPLFPAGLIYGVARPLAYWIGYTRFSKYQDEIARGISGISFSIIYYVIF